MPNLDLENFAVAYSVIETAATAAVYGMCGIQVMLIADIWHVAVYTVRWSIVCEGHCCMGPIGVS